MLAHLPELVVKETQGSGGYGMLVGPAARPRREIEAFREASRRPKAYIAQPTLACRPARPSSRAASPRATSTCARSCCPAAKPAWCPAA